jgi:chromosome segregation ATPase
MRDRARGAERKRTTTASSPRADAYALPPGPDATIPELEAAKVEVQDQRSYIEEQEKPLSSDLRRIFDARALIGDEIERLAQLVAQGHEDKLALQRRIAVLEKERAELSRKIVQLRDQLSSMRGERLSLTAEESKLNDRRADLYFAWARSEELKANGLKRQLADTVRQHAVEVSDREQKLAAADQLIVGLRSPRAL